MQIAGIQAWFLWFLTHTSWAYSWEKIGTFDENRDPLETQMLKKVPVGTRVPK